MRQEIRKVKQLTDKPFGLQLNPTGKETDHFTGPMMQLVFDEGLTAVAYGGAILPEIFQELHAHNVKVIFRTVASTPENSREAEVAGADIIVASGFDAGGTLPEKVVGTFSMIPMIVDAVDHTPVLASGGIVDQRTARAAMALGADGVYAGTIFLLSQESRMAENVKQLAVNAAADQLLMYRAFPGYYRSLPGKLADKLVTLDKSGASGRDIFTAAGAFEGMHQGMILGNLDQGYASLGLGISSVHEIKPVEKIVAELADGIAQEL